MAKTDNEPPTGFSIHEIKGFIKDFYGLSAEVKPLDGHLDWNYQVSADNGKQYIFKIAHADVQRSFLEAQNGALEHIAAQDSPLPCPQVVRTASGKTIFDVQNSTQTSHFARMLTYLPGTFFGDLNLEDRNPLLFQAYGSFLGKLDNILASFYHPALNRYMNWDLKNTPELENQLNFMTDHGLRNLVHHFIGLYCTEVAPLLHRLPTGIIHGDGNDYNVLVDDIRTGIAGLIDFGDMVMSCTVFELAIAVSYVIPGQSNMLDAACQLVEGYYRQRPLNETELHVLYYLIGARLCQTLVISGRMAVESPADVYQAISLDPARKTLEWLIAVNPDHAEHRFRQACGLLPKDTGRDVPSILEIRERHLGKALSVSYKKPLKIVRGFMQYLYDHTGRAYLDTVNNVCHVGHCHPRAVRAAQQQIARLNTNTRYLHDHLVEYALELTATLPDPLTVCFFVCTGSEANELALRMARIHTGADDIVVLDHAYHGNTHSIIQVSPYKFNGPGGKGKGAHVQVAPLPDPYRGTFKGYSPETGQAYSESVLKAFQLIEKSGRKAAAFLHESIPGVAGQVVFPETFLQHAYAHARQNGALCIADEVQIGFGRVGSHMWAFETQGVVPDIVTMGKPIGNGHPLAAVVTTQEVADSFNNGMEYFNTFGGNPVSCAIGREVLKIIREEGLQENARQTGGYMKAGLAELMNRHALIGDVRGLGLYIGIELVENRETLTPAKTAAYYIAESMKEEGILVSVDGPLHNVLKIKPPMVFNKKNAALYIDTLDAILSKNTLS